jgi:hypothetical protein
MEVSMTTAMDHRARRSAQRAGLVARKSRSGNVLENLGGYMIVDPRTNIPVAGFRYDLNPQEVIDFCTAD